MVVLVVATVTEVDVVGGGGDVEEVVGGGGLVLVVGGRVVELVVGAGGRVVEELVDVDELVVGRTVDVVLEVVGEGALVVEVLEPPGVVGEGVVLVVEPRGNGDSVELVTDVLLVAPVLLVTFVLLVTLLVVGPVPGGRLVVVVLDATIGAGHAIGAGALRAAKLPGLSLPILPPKRRQ